jgi:hypothetical protein
MRRAVRGGCSRVLGSVPTNEMGTHDERREHIGVYVRRATEAASESEAPSTRKGRLDEASAAAGLLATMEELRIRLGFPVRQ